jgi:hypothetical protein
VNQPIVTIRFSIEFECKYNPFEGRTPEAYADLLDTDLHELLKEFRENEIDGIFSTIEKVELNDSYD